ncbi:CDP-glucose 4,6-dehydratase [Cetobacterium sp. 2A]|uniref:CDP-glucose 4,6-dehydratase n=1 Tax=Cetobacterium sp. 2A TaxID=2754723 RepID=UPI00163BD453|nr:CDP-glucose 4,6-dehydratase [Cetobacterium sp. 2A]MBC2856158.1 CDP-glucose 4,6-dehydratase [Cetobacterium sp. 2A]
MIKKFNNIYKGKKVLVTGHTGFKGSWLSIWLNELGAEVIGYSLDPYTQKDNFILCDLSKKMTDIRGDIRDKEKLGEVFIKYKPEIIFHLAAQPLVRLSYDIPLETYEVNVMGTINIMEEIRKSDSAKIGIFITTDKCYENQEQVWGYRENEPMGGYDPYSSSKGACEIAINSWRRSFFNPDVYEKHGKSIASVRAGNVIGGGDWAKDRIIPDCIRALEEKKVIDIRMPKAVRPWEHVLEPLSGYLLLGQRMLENPGKYCEGYNFGPTLDAIVPVWDVADMVKKFYGSGEMRDSSNLNAPHEAKLLLLDITKARFELDWKPTLTIENSIELTVEWYKRYTEENVYNLCLQQIEKFCNYGEK